jgi:predicted GIY-YIG superfamily endonuclease
MPNYQNGKIYKICSSLTDKIYIGSTTNYLVRRMSDHRSKYIRKKKGHQLGYYSNMKMQTSF